MNLEFEKLTENLLHRYECVVLPDFGGFIVRDSPCNFNAAGNVIKPKSRHIFFNPHLKHNDGLIYNEISLRYGLNYQDAINFYQKTLSEYKQVLQDTSSVKFGNLGTFFQGKENNYWFAPGNINLSLDTYGLENIDVVKIIKKAATAEQEPVKETKIVELIPDNKPIEEVEKISRPGYKAWLVAATVALLVHFVYLKVETTDVTTNEATVLPSIDLIVSQDKTNPDTLALPDSTAQVTYDQDSAITTSSVDESNPVSDGAQTEAPASPVESLPAVKEKVPVETSQTIVPEIQFSRVAKYRLEANALSHSNDLIKKGQKAKVEQNGNWYEVLIEQ